MFIFGDCHIGSNRRNKWLYKKAIDTWENMVMEIARNPNYRNETIVFAGDLWDSDRPTPKDFMVVKNAIDTITGRYNEYLNMVMIPGNHDRVGIDGVCAADVFSDDWEIGTDKKNIVVFNMPFEKWTEYSNEKSIQYYFLPYSADILEQLKEISESAKKYVLENPDEQLVLVSHFTTKEMNPFAGIISEYDNAFAPFDLVILGDCHICYDSGKFHTTGSTYMFNVDEMNSKKCIPSYLHVDGLKVNRITFPELKPQIIDSEDEATDDEQLYLIIGNEVINVTKPNVFVKYKPNKDTDDSSVELTESVEIRSINKDKVFEIMYPELDESERRLIKMYANGEIEIEDVVNGNTIVVKGREGITSVELDAELEGLLNEEEF